MKKALIVSGTYLFFGVVWIIFSDMLLATFLDVPEKVHDIQNFKGILFVVLSAILIFVLNKVLTAKIDRQKDQLQHTSEELKLILDNTEELIGLVEVKDNGDFVFKRANKSYYRTLKNNGIERTDFDNRELKKHLEIVTKKGLSVPFAEELENYYKQVAQTKKSLVVDYEYGAKGDITRVLQMRLSPIVSNDLVTHIIFVSEDITEKHKIERENTNSNIQVLSTQLNPHFMFNALSSVQYFILEEKTEAAINYLSSFSGLMRKTLNNSMKILISLDTEIEFLDEYIQLEIQRRDQRVKYEIYTETGEYDQEEIYIPPMILQPFIENAFIHGFHGDLKDMQLKLFFKVENTQLICIIDDNGIGRKKSKQNKPTKEEKKSHGMRLVNERLRLLNKLYKDAFKISVHDKEELNNNERGTKVEITMPLFIDGEMEG